MIKMLVIDLDDTLLHTDKTISAYSESILKKADAAGIKIVPATARPIRAVNYYLTQIPCDAVICHNGAVTLLDGKRTGQCYSVPLQEAKNILVQLQSRNPRRKLSVEINDKIYANFDTALIWGKSAADIEMLKASSVPTDFSDLPDIDADKVLIELNSAEEYEEITALLPDDVYGELSDGGTLCLIMNKKAKKLNAVRCLAECWGIGMEDIAAFGEDYNDVEMLTHCGTGVAMKNAVAEALGAADFVTDTSNEDGVAHYIEKYVL